MGRRIGDEMEAARWDSAPYLNAEMGFVFLYAGVAATGAKAHSRGPGRDTSRSSIPNGRRSRYQDGRSKLEAVEAEIRSLSREEAESLQDWLSEYLLASESDWTRIIHDPRPRPALTALGDAIEAQLKATRSATRSDGRQGR